MRVRPSSVRDNDELGLYLDHVLIAVRDLDRAGLDFAHKLGFTLTPVGLHPGRGTHNRLIVLRSEYLELIAIRDLAEAQAARRRLASFLASREGLFMLALGTGAIAKAAATLQGRGVPVEDPVAGARQGKSGQGGYTWRYAPIAPEGLPGAPAFLIQHDQQLQERYRDAPHPGRHNNDVIGIHRIALAVQNAAKAAARWQALLGLEAVPAGDSRSTQAEACASLQLQNCCLDFISPEAEGRLSRFLTQFGEGLYLLALEVGDLDHTIAFLADRGVAVTEIREGAEGRMAEVAAPQAHGVLLRFVQT